LCERDELDLQLSLRNKERVQLELQLKAKAKELGKLETGLESQTAEVLAPCVFVVVAEGNCSSSGGGLIRHTQKVKI
jgi:hypothetical protein